MDRWQQVQWDGGVGDVVKTAMWNGGVGDPMKAGISWGGGVGDPQKSIIMDSAGVDAVDADDADDADDDDDDDELPNPNPENISWGGGVGDAQRSVKGDFDDDVSSDVVADDADDDDGLPNSENQGNQGQELDDGDDDDGDGLAADKQGAINGGFAADKPWAINGELTADNQGSINPDEWEGAVGSSLKVDSLADLKKIEDSVLKHELEMKGQEGTSDLDDPAILGENDNDDNDDGDDDEGVPQSQVLLEDYEFDQMRNARRLPLKPSFGQGNLGLFPH